MTKKELIEAIQNRETEMYIGTLNDELRFGSDSATCKTSRTAWNSIFKLMIELDIPTDPKPEAYNRISELVVAIYRKNRLLLKEDNQIEPPM
jgi:hypothetical protein